MKTLFILASVLVGLFIAAPSQIEAQKRPSPVNGESIVNAYFRNKVMLGTEGRASFIFFRKTNGYHRGDGTYALEGYFDIRLVKDTDERGYMKGDIFCDTQCINMEGRNAETFTSKVRFYKGTILRHTGHAVLRMTEQGWRAEGFVFTTTRVLTVTPPKGPIPAKNDTPFPSTGLRKAIVLSEQANLRKSPDQHGKIVNKVTKGAIVEIIKQNGAWFLVKYAGSTGWVHGNTIRLGNNTDP